jgi:hypothetical protein
MASIAKMLTSDARVEKKDVDHLRHHYFSFASPRKLNLKIEESRASFGERF